MLEHLQRLPIDVVERFLVVRDSKKIGISEALGNYILELNAASNLHRKYRSVGDCAKRLQLLYPNLTIPTCKKRIYDAINFFNTDCTVTAAAWDNYFADYMMNLADVNLIGHNTSEARRCAENARKYRLNAAANIISPERTRFKHQIVSSEVKLERMMDTSPKGLLGAWDDIQVIIQNTPSIPQFEKDRLKKEAARELNIDYTIEDTEYKELENEGQEI